MKEQIRLDEQRTAANTERLLLWLGVVLYSVLLFVGLYVVIH